MRTAETCRSKATRRSAHLRQLIRLRPHQSVRETKRLLTVWGFYMRLLKKMPPANETATAAGACNVLTLAEIVTRWPALVPAMGPTPDGESGLRKLILVTQGDDANDAEVKWHLTLRELGLDTDEYRVATANLGKLLRAHGTLAVAEYAECAL